MNTNSLNFFSSVPVSGLVTMSAAMILVRQCASTISPLSMCCLMKEHFEIICLLRLKLPPFITIPIVERLSWSILMGSLKLKSKSRRRIFNHKAKVTASSKHTISDSVDDLVTSLNLKDLLKIGADPRVPMIPPWPFVSSCSI